MSEETKQVTAADVRAAFPRCVAVADEFRAVFGPDVKLVYACENGREIGNLGESPETTLNGLQMILSGDLGEEPNKQGRRNG